MNLQFIKLLQEVWGYRGLLMAPAVCLGVFILKMLAKHMQVYEWDAVTWGFNQPGDEPQKIVSLVG